MGSAGAGLSPAQGFCSLPPSAPCIAPDASGAFERYGSRIDSSTFVFRRPQNSAPERERMQAPCQLIQKEGDYKKLSEMVAELKCLADKKGSVSGTGIRACRSEQFPECRPSSKHCVCPVLPVTDLLGPAGKIATQ